METCGDVGYDAGWMPLSRTSWVSNRLLYFLLVAYAEQSLVMNRKSIFGNLSL